MNERRMEQRTVVISTIHTKAQDFLVPGGVIHDGVGGRRGSWWTEIYELKVTQECILSTLRVHYSARMLMNMIFEAGQRGERHAEQTIS
jgi:hypothetical protein